MTRKSLLRILLEPLLAAVVLALLVRSVARIYAVPSDSMAPALLAGDRILVTRFLTDTPARGDIVVFRHPTEDALHVKRVVGIAGDVVEAQIVRPGTSS
jgi:signal peptidase I